MSRTIALFDSWRGSYECNPRAISERLGELRPDVRRVWVLRDPAEAPEGVVAVRPFSPRHLYYLARADVVFANNAMPHFWRKLPHTTYVQTWHGPAFKKIGWDIPEPDPEWAAYLRKFDKDVRQWDLLLTPGPSATRHFPPAFRYDGRVLESGSPRSDLLIDALASGRRAEVRERWGIGPSTRAVLFAPTFKDGGRREEEVQSLVWTWEQHLDPADVLMIRAHPHDPLLAGHRSASDRVLNLSEADGVDVLLAADVLVTDFSSIFYDFALTGQPMVFLVEDGATAAQQGRGFYHDVEHDLPGPVVGSYAELFEVLRRPPEPGGYAEWLSEHLPHEDGHVAERVIEAVLGAR